VCAGGEAARTHPYFPRFVEKIHNVSRKGGEQTMKKKTNRVKKARPGLKGEKR
jgi:hypothetical protein